jgi:putative spermidine/putrescine transport system substrate-binding protein
MRAKNRAPTLIALVLAIGLASFAGPARPGAALPNQQSTDKLVIVGWGGSYQEAQRKAFFEPFEAATGVQITEDTGPQIERSQAEVATGHPSFDLTATNQPFYMIGLENNLWEPIDYQYFRPEDLAAMPDQVRLPYGVATIYYAEGMAISTTAFPPGQPQPNSWADFWDVQRFPGKRIMPSCDLGTYPIPEAALLADGVPPDQLFPIDVPRAIRKLKELVPYVTTWYKDVAQAGQLLVNGEGVMSMAPDGRIKLLIQQGAPIQFVWNQSRYTYDVWYVLKGAANRDNAMRFIAFASQPQPQADMARLSLYAPTNPQAFDLIDQETAKLLVTYPDNFRQTIQKNETWWKANRDMWIEECTKATLGQ